jgi:hypothetical protein
MAYFGDRERGPKPRTSEEITSNVWKAIWGHIQTRIDNGAFGIDFPEMCSDGNGPYGTNIVLMEAAAHGDAIVWPITSDGQPEDPIEIFECLSSAMPTPPSLSRARGTASCRTTTCRSSVKKVR